MREMIYPVQKVVLMKFMQNEPIPTWKIHKKSKNEGIYVMG